MKKICSLFGVLLSCLAVNSLSDSCEYLSERDVGTIIIPPKTMINTDDPYIQINGILIILD